MKIRHVTLECGTTYQVPPRIQRIDTKSTHGWQVRYNGTKFFKDGDAQGAGAAAALAAATRELAHRMATTPAPVVLKRGPSAHKSSTLPPGISGPIVQRRSGQTGLSASLSVLLPQFGAEARVRSIYIAAQSTYTPKKFKAALAKAIEMRSEAVQAYEAAATRARRKEAAVLRSSLRGG